MLSDKETIDLFTDPDIRKQISEQLDSKLQAFIGQQWTLQVELQMQYAIQELLVLSFNSHLRVTKVHFDRGVVTGFDVILL